MIPTPTRLGVRIQFAHERIAIFLSGGRKLSDEPFDQVTLITGGEYANLPSLVLGG
jgi:hypothetical protein